METCQNYKIYLNMSSFDKTGMDLPEAFSLETLDGIKN